MPVPPRIELALTPTPILKLERLSRRLGVELHVKRDDLTGLLEAGGMARKLEFLAGEALAAGADVLVTGGAPQSDGCRAVAAVAARLGLRAVVALAGEAPESSEGNLLLDRLLGADVVHLGARPVAGALEEIAAELRRTGARPYVIGESGAGEVGALGYLECAVELAEQIAHGAPRFDTVAIGAWSGTSQAGLLMGKHLAGLPAEILGIPVAADAEAVRRAVGATIERAIRRFGFALDVPKGIFLLDGGRAGESPETGDEDVKALVALARDEGLVLDPVHTVKAFRALLDTLGRDAKALGQRVCFVHTGGPFGVFSLGARLDPFLGRPARHG